MLEILKNNFYLPLYAIAWVLSVVKYPKYFDSCLQYFPILIGYTLCTEILGTAILNYDNVSLIFEENFNYYNVLFYNIYDFLFFTYFYYIYYHMTRPRAFKKVLKYGAGLYLLIEIGNIFIANPLYHDLWYAYTFGTLLLIVCIFGYLFSLRGLSKAHISSNLLFWISIGSLIFLIGYLPIMILKNNPTWIPSESAPIIRMVHLILITIMYGSYCTGFLLMRRMPTISKELG